MRIAYLVALHVSAVSRLQKLRILYFTRDYTTHDHRFLAALARTEHEVAYLRLERGSRQLEDRSLPEGVTAIPWAGGRRPASFWDGPRLLADLRRVIQEFKPDLVQSGPLQRSAFLVALSGFRPLVSMSWGYDLLHDASRNSLWRWATQYTLTRSAIMVGDCATIRQKAISFGMPGDRIVTFPWGVDINHYSPDGSGRNQPDRRERLGWGAETFVLLSTRGWEPIYGVDLIARAFARLAPQRPELRLLMLGNGSLSGELRRIFRQAGVLEQVHFPGQVNQRDLPRYYRAADLYLSASHSDGTSISLLEAMACGRPALVSDIPGNREWVFQGENGWWFENGDVESLTQALLCAIEERGRLPQMGRAARRLAEQRANWERNFPKLLEAYNLALQYA
jgi:glycosyltransferase involved in cell wall biosynthesis